MYSGPATGTGTTVYLNVYDLHTANRYAHTFGVGVYHTGVEIAGNEYTYAGGAGIFAMSPKVAPGAVFRESIRLGNLVDAPGALRRALDILRPDFGPDDYSLVKNNCNHFANALVMELLGKPIPSYLNRLASFGSFFSCFLPADMTSQAPVNQEGGGGGGAAYPSVQRYVGAPTPTYTAFGGEGMRMSQGPVKSARNESEIEKREMIRQATLARMEGGGGRAGDGGRGTGAGTASLS